MRCIICNEITENYNTRTLESICDECASVIEDTIFEVEEDEEHILEEGWEDEV